MHFDRHDSVSVLRWWSRALVSVSCVFCGCLLWWSVVLRPGVFGPAVFRIACVLRVFRKCDLESDCEWRFECECECVCEGERESGETFDRWYEILLGLVKRLRHGEE